MINGHIFITRGNIPLHICASKNLPARDLSKMHFHETFEILYNTKGAIRCCFNDRDETILNEGDILFINSNVPHQTFCLEEGTDCVLFQFRNPSSFDFHHTALTEFLNSANTTAYVFKPDDEDYAELTDCLSDMLRLYNEKAPSFIYYLTSNIYVLMAIFSRKKFIISEDNLINSNLLEKIMPVFEYIDNNYAEHLTLEDLAKSVNFHKEYFCRLFKQATGSTVVDYLNFVRVHKAEQLLKNNRNITDVAYRVGFASASYFTKIFKKYRLCSPSTYKAIYENPEKLFLDTSYKSNTAIYESPKF